MAEKSLDEQSLQLPDEAAAVSPPHSAGRVTLSTDAELPYRRLWGRIQ